MMESIKEFFEAEDMTNAEFMKIALLYMLSAPVIVAGTWLLYAALYALTGVR